MINQNSKFITHNFPKGFFWGASTSAHQIEGNNINSDWWQFEQEGHIKNGDVSGVACDHWHRFREDFALAKELGHNAHRFSIEWAKIEPKQGHWNETAIEHYRQVFASLKENGLEPFPTLWHFTLPLWVAEKGGWNNPKIVDWFGEYVKKVAKEIGFIGHWITLNEPMVYLYMGYISKIWPPHKNILAGFKMIQNMTKSHKRAFSILKGLNQKNLIGLAHNANDFQSKNNGWEEKLLAKLLLYFSNDLLINKIKNHLDWLGLNYYFHHEIAWLSSGKLLPNPQAEEPTLISDIVDSVATWGIYPTGIYEVIKYNSKFGKPIYITENGLADAADTRREAFIIHHIEQMKRAIKDGFDVRGYLHWSLLDNFEWQEGFYPKFGLVEVDYNTQKRTPRPSAWVYKHIIERSNE